VQRDVSSYPPEPALGRFELVVNLTARGDSTHENVSIKRIKSIRRKHRVQHDTKSEPTHTKRCGEPLWALDFVKEKSGENQQDRQYFDRKLIGVKRGDSSVDGSEHARAIYSRYK